MDGTFLKIVFSHYFWKVAKIKAAMTENVAAGHFLEDFMDGARFELFGCSLAVPLLVFTDITAKVTERRIA